MALPSTFNRMHTSPLTVPRTMRVHTARSLTSLPAGKMVPITAVPLLREDSIASGRLRFSFEMMETAEILMNAIHVKLHAYLVPTLAFERFGGSMDALNRSYAGESVGEQDVIPFVETADFGAYGTNDIYVYLGLHGRPDQKVNTGYLEAYNAIWNFRAKNRSEDLFQSSKRTRLQANLAPAFWPHEQFKHIVPDFDQAVIDGEVPLNIVDGKMPVHGLGLSPGAGWSSAGSTINLVGGTTEETVATVGSRWSTGSSTDPQSARIKEDAANPGFPDVFAELAENGVTVSLSNIELARKTQAFARLRERYQGHTDEWLINMLMDGLSIPDQALKQPILVGQASTIFGMSKRYATDAGNMTESVVNGATFVDMSIRVPKLATGGVVMVVAEILPEQLFERQRDAYLHAQDVDDFPHYLRDELDPEKVAVVPNEYVDIDHDQPTATFGYAPLNYEWNSQAPRIGGRFYRPEVDAGFDEDRQRIWAVEVQNPTLSEDFYIATNIHTKPFVVTNQDPFEVVTQGDFLIQGNTVFGGALVEASENYAKVLEQAPMERIEKPSE